MIEAKFHSVTLNDDEVIGAVVDKYCIKARPFPSPDRHRLPDFPDDAPLPLWTDYFLMNHIESCWYKQTVVWFQPQVEFNRLVVCELTGFQKKSEANAVLERWKKQRRPPNYRPTEKELADFANQVVNPSNYERHSAFAYALRNIRKLFAWDGETVIDSQISILPISGFQLLDSDIDVLREVYRRVGPFGNDVDFGEPKAQVPRAKIEDLKHARKKVSEFSREFANEGFDLWSKECLQPATQERTQSADLYQHYKEWLRKGGHGANRQERTEVKATALSHKLWGPLMVRRYPRYRDGRGHKYQVTIKRGA